jgi:N-acetylglucosaminyldiphosphoundecaprenol N-acetyl-beta-D-mannosaminyltransferase
VTNPPGALASEPSTLRHSGIERVAIGHALIDNCSATQACERIVGHARSKGRASYVATANAQHIVLLNKNARFREVYSRADLVVADGMSLLFAARLYRRSLQQRVAGVDIFEMLCGMAAEQGLQVFLLGGRPGSAQLAGVVLRARYPGLRLATYCPEFGFELTQEGLEGTANAIRSVKPDLLFVALGAPKQEFWIYEHGLALAVPVSMGVGGSFELIAGVLPRAPEWLQQTGLEWLYRLCLEPRRMWRRYLIGNAEFAATVGRQYVRGALLEVFYQWTGRVRPAAELQGSGS